MGADLIGWRGCPLQEELGPEGFLGKLKLRVYKRAIEERVPEDKRATVEVVVRVDGRPDRKLKYRAICDEADQFARGIPDCARCPLSSGSALGCYHYINYPVDPTAEQAIFDFFIQDVMRPDGICGQLYRDVVSHVDGDSPWYTRRGGEGMTLAELSEPLSFTWHDDEGEHTVDSAQVMQALFITLDDPALLVGYARFYAELGAFVDERLRELGLRQGEDGSLEVHLAVPEGTAADELPQTVAGKAAEAILQARAMVDSRGLQQMRHFGEMLRRMVPGAVASGWSVLADA